MPPLSPSVCSAVATVLPAQPAAADETLPEVDRVLVVSMPTLSWADVNEYDLPNLSAFIDESAVAGLSTRAIDRLTTPGDGYATINTGVRADGDEETDGLAFEAEERFLGQPAAEIFARRTGITVDSGLVSLALLGARGPERRPRVRRRGRDVGRRPAARAVPMPRVIANADGSSEAPETVIARQAVISLMDTDGQVPSGQVSDALLELDPEAPVRTPPRRRTRWSRPSRRCGTRNTAWSWSRPPTWPGPTPTGTWPPSSSASASTAWPSSAAMPCSAGCSSRSTPSGTPCW